MSELPKAVFLSYASQDADAANRICEALSAAGVDVWFDQSELVGGDAWDQKIRGQIKACALFMPVISAASQARREGYFRLEWKLAVQRAQTMADGTPFLLPVVVDATHDAEALVPEEFRAVQWTHLSGGVPTPAFVARVRTLLGGPATPIPSAGHAVSAAAAGSAGPAPEVAAPARRSALSAAAIAGLVAVVLGLVAFIALRAPTTGGFAAPAKSVAETAAPAATAATDKSIAVLPFENMSEDKSANAFFADGIHETILTNLAHIRELRVVSRTSVMEYRGKTENLRDIARKLNVAYILEGSVQRSGKKVRVTGQLIRAATDEHLWANDYTRDLTAGDIFDIQSELAQKIAASLQAALSPQEKNLLTQRPTENLDAYDLYLRARAQRRDNENSAATSVLLRQENLLQAAVKLDPKFAAAWAELGIVHSDTYFFGVDYSAARLDAAKAAIDTATRLAPDAPDVIRATAEYYFHGLRDYPRAAALYSKLVGLQPNDPNSYSGLGFVQRRQGQFALALANFRRALQLDPGDYRVQQAVALTLEGGHRYDEAAEVRRRMATFRAGGPAETFDVAREAFLARGSIREIEAWYAGLSPPQAQSADGLAARSRWMMLVGNYAEAASLIRNDDPRSVNLRLVASSAALLVASGDPRLRAGVEGQAVEQRALVGREPDNSVANLNLAGLEALLGHADEARRFALKATTMVPESADAFSGPGYSAVAAMVSAWTGDKARATAEVARLLRVPLSGLNIHELKHDPRFFPLQGYGPFEALLTDPKNNAPLF